MNEEKSRKTRRWEQRYRELDKELANGGVSAGIRNKVLRRVHHVPNSSHVYGTRTIASSASASLERVIASRGGP